MRSLVKYYLESFYKTKAWPGRPAAEWPREAARPWQGQPSVIWHFLCITLLTQINLGHFTRHIKRYHDFTVLSASPLFGISLPWLTAKNLHAAIFCKLHFMIWSRWREARGRESKRQDWWMIFIFHRLTGNIWILGQNIWMKNIFHWSQIHTEINDEGSTAEQQ